MVANCVQKMCTVLEVTYSTSKQTHQCLHISYCYF